ncbi:MAG: FHA domain-containing protein [Tepidisphaeraceae bacterium]
MTRGNAASGQAPGRGPAYLTVIVNHTEVQRRPIAGPITIGHGLDCDLWLEDPALSRKHCQLEPALEGDGWVVTDLNSRNGTYVNAVRVMQRQPLNHKDVITLGKTHLKFHSHGYIPPRPTDPGAALLMPARTRAAIDDRTPTPHHSSGRPLPTPKVTSHDSTLPSPGETLSGSMPLPFTRPPAKPMVKPVKDDED